MHWWDIQASLAQKLSHGFGSSGYPSASLASRSEESWMGWARFVLWGHLNQGISCAKWDNASQLGNSTYFCFYQELFQGYQYNRNPSKWLTEKYFYNYDGFLLFY